MILAGDIGGTHTRLALFETNGRDLKMVVDARFPSREFPNLLTIVQKFLDQQKTSVSCVCFGIAGPVRNGRCKATNLPWIVESNELKSELNIPSVVLLNDLEANAWGVRVLRPSDFFVLQAGAVQKGNMALISAGTGLGEAGLFWNGEEHCPFATEGGHADFAARDVLENELMLYLKKTFHDHVSCERVVSGPGLLALYRFLIETKREIESLEVKKEMAHRDPSAVISEWGCGNRDRACAHVVEWFSSLYGAEAGNVALKFFSLGGVYIGGGIAPHMLSVIKRGGFLKAFLNKGRFKSLLETIPIRIVLNDEMGLLGAAEYARLEIESSRCR